METVIRVFIVYVMLLIAFRVIGKRELSKLSPFELVTLLIVPEIFQQALMREDFSMTNAIVATSTLLSLVFVTSVFSYRWQAVHRLTSGYPTVLVHEGELLRAHMDQERVPAEEILAEVHKAGLEHIEQVKWAILEEDGKISVIPRDHKEGSVRPSDDSTVA